MPPVLNLKVCESIDWNAKCDDSIRTKAELSSSEEEEENVKAKKIKPEDDKWVMDSSGKEIQFNPVSPAYHELETVYECDQLVSEYPNCSKAWLLYMVFHLKQAEVDKARNVAERALKTISFREEKEKYNIWVALLNLENLYGTQESLMSVFERATACNEPLSVYSHLLEVYLQTQKIEEAEQLLQKMLKKFKSSKEVWLKAGIFYMQSGRVNEARKLLERSSKSLEKKDYAEIEGRFACLEYIYGDPERGHTMFENVIEKYPKRKDLRYLYVNILNKTGHQEQAKLLTLSS